MMLNSKQKKKMFKRKSTTRVLSEGEGWEKSAWKTVTWSLKQHNNEHKQKLNCAHNENLLAGNLFGESKWQPSVLLWSFLFSCSRYCSRYFPILTFSSQHSQTHLNASHLYWNAFWIVSSILLLLARVSIGSTTGHYAPYTKWNKVLESPWLKIFGIILFLSCREFLLFCTFSAHISVCR